MVANLVSVSDAASSLDVSASHVHRLLDRGLLRGRWLGSQRVLYAESLNEYRLTRPKPGRPLDAKASWSALLQARPRRIEELGELAARTRRRSIVHHGHVLPFRLEEVTGAVGVVVSGPLGASRQGALVGVDGPAHLYLPEHRWPALASTFEISEADDDLNLITRVVPDAAWPFGPEVRQAPLVVCAVDAYSAADLRSAHEALDRMEALGRGAEDLR